MPLSSLVVRNFRVYENGEIQPDPGINLITGGNASGKTTILEAIHVLGSGRSFRTSQSEHLLRHGSTSWQLRAKVAATNGHIPVDVDISVDQEGRQIRIGASRTARLSELAQQLPVLAISPDSHFEFHTQTKIRRSALDWMLFHVEPAYQDLWSRYHRALQQRNAALKDPRQSRTRFSWDEELAIHGDDIQARRQAELNHFRAEFREISTSLIGVDLDCDLYLESGWEDANGLAQCLKSDRDRDSARGFTHSGPHRNDLVIRLGGQPVRDEASHGQNKLLVIALRLAQLQKLHRLTGKHCCLLVDDLPAELDSERRARLSQFFTQLPAQIFVTATDPGLIETNGWKGFRRFHVEHGTIRIVE